jgi:hypothetical protein
MKKKIVKINIPAFTDREKIAAALAENGYKVWIEKTKKSISTTEYFVCFEY